ncbi:hypothetical protein C240_1191 [Enterococcus sp. 5H]|nr:hypothetical protein [Enterococcus sp. 5H]
MSNTKAIRQKFWLFIRAASAFLFVQNLNQTNCYFTIKEKPVTTNIVTGFFMFSTV